MYMHSADYHDQQTITIEVNILKKKTVKGTHYKMQNFTIKAQYLGMILHNMNNQALKLLK